MQKNILLFPSQGDDQLGGRMAVPGERKSEVGQAPNPTTMVAATKAEEELPALSFGRTMRTRNLLLAALRVWELRNGIHDY